MAYVDSVAQEDGWVTVILTAGHAIKLSVMAWLKEMEAF